jgi:pimeloyl-ACP methyl ester carboxylesterase
MIVNRAPGGVQVHERDLPVRSGRLRAHCWGFDDDREGLVVCVPGLSSNAVGFDAIAKGLALCGHRVAALDLRGRARSETTPPGTYGWPAHARDVVDAARGLGFAAFDLVGHSMGAYVAMQAAADHPAAVGRLVLIDGAGVPEPAALGPIGEGLGRLDRWHPSEDAYVEAVRSAGIVRPWNAVWDRFYRYELERGDDGRVRSLTSRDAVMEDVEYGRRHRQDALWPRLHGPALLIRAARPLGTSGGFIVAAADAASFAATVPGAAVAPVDANHFGVLTDPASVAAITAFLAGTAS